MKKVTSIRMISKIRTSLLDSPGSITLTVHFIDPRGRVRWEFCSRFREGRLRARVMWMWRYQWLVEKWLNNVMEFYLLREIILVIKKLYHSKSLHVKSYLSWIKYVVFCHRYFLRDEKLTKTRISHIIPTLKEFLWSFLL